MESGCQNGNENTDDNEIEEEGCSHACSVDLLLPSVCHTGGRQWELTVHDILVLVHHLVVTISEADANVNADAVDIGIDDSDHLPLPWQ